MTKANNLISSVHKLLTKNKTVVVIIILIGIIGAIRSCFQINKQKVHIQASDLRNSPIVVDSPGTSISIPETNSSSYREIDINTESEINKNLSDLALKYKGLNLSVIVEAESGNSIRTRIAKKLGELLKKHNLGFYPEGNTFIGRFPDYPITVLCSADTKIFAKDFINSIRLYISGKIDIKNNLPDVKFIKIYLNGSPVFTESGSVKFE